MDKEVVKELIQNELNTKNIVKELQLILNENRENILSDYEKLRQKLGGKGASDNAADIIVRKIIS